MKQNYFDSKIDEYDELLFPPCAEKSKVTKKKWLNACRIAFAINKAIDEGYIILDEEGQQVKTKFEIWEEGIFQPFFEDENGSGIVFYDNEESMYQNSIKEYNKIFSQWNIVSLENALKLKL